MKTHPLALVAAAAFAALGFNALAQPAAPHGAPGDLVEIIATLKANLNLNTSQQQQWDSVVAQSQAARQAGRTRFAQLKAATDAELAKPQPDLAALAAQADAVREQASAARKAARDGWLALYANLTPDQKTIVRDAIAAKLASIEQAHAQRLQQRGQQ